MAATTASTFRRSERSWFRFDPNGDHPMVLGPDDMTPCHGTNPPEYDPDCSMCWLGYQHSEALHAARLIRTV